MLLLINRLQKNTVVEQSAAAHTEGTGFNINSFIKPEQNAVSDTNIPVNPAQQMIQAQQTQEQAQQQIPPVFVHATSGLSDAEMIADIEKHFKIIYPGIPVTALYDLAHNKYLAKKMKELNCKQRSNNPYLTQVNPIEYIGDKPELMQKYNLVFTMPCNDKGYIIVVMFNTMPETNQNSGTVQYPLHIVKAKLKNASN